MRIAADSEAKRHMKLRMEAKKYERLRIEKRAKIKPYHLKLVELGIPICDLCGLNLSCYKEYRERKKQETSKNG